MSETNDAPPPPPEDPTGSPFPESSLTPPPQEEPSPPPAPSLGIPTPPPAPVEPVAAPPQPPAAEPPSRPWMEPAPPETPAVPAAPAGGLVSGDPLGSSPPAPPAFPPGYTSPPPPGAGGAYTPPPATSFGAASPITGQYVLAGWWRRVGAAVIDGIIITFLAFVVMTPLGIGIFSSTSDGDADGGFIAMVLGFIVAGLVIAAVALAYAPVMMGKTNGKTLGRMATGIRVVRADGQAITIGFAAIREVAVKALLIGTVAGSLTFGLASLLDVLWPLWDDENRALHDFVVNTRTVMDSA